MAESKSVLAHLMPFFEEPIEDRGTDALAYILNKSATCREALDDLIRDGEFQPNRIAKLKTQVTDDLQSRPDMVGLDSEGKRRLMVEVKFWAILQPRQAWRYYQKLDKSGPGVLLFICPEKGIQQYWPKICAQLEEDTEKRVPLERLEISDGFRRARAVKDPDRHVVMASWELLLDRLGAAAEESEIRSDIHQLRGLVERQNEEAFLPLEADASESAFERRDLKLQKLIGDAKQRGVQEDWLSKEGLTGSKRRRYFAVEGASPPWLALDIQYGGRFERTPIWIMMRTEDWRSEQKLTGMIKDRDYCWLPIELKSNASPEAVLDDLVAKLKAIADDIKKAHPQ